MILHVMVAPIIVRAGWGCNELVPSMEPICVRMPLRRVGFESGRRFCGRIETHHLHPIGPKGAWGLPPGSAEKGALVEVVGFNPPRKNGGRIRNPPGAVVAKSNAIRQVRD